MPDASPSREVRRGGWGPFPSEVNCHAFPDFWRSLRGNWARGRVAIVSTDATRAPNDGGACGASHRGGSSARGEAGHHGARGDRGADAGRRSEGGPRRAGPHRGDRPRRPPDRRQAGRGRPPGLRRRRHVRAPGHARRGRVRADLRRAAVAPGPDHRRWTGRADPFGRGRRGQRARGRAAHAARGGRPGRRRRLRGGVGHDAVRPRGAGLRALPSRGDHHGDLRRQPDQRRARRRRGHRARYRPRGDRRLDPPQGRHGDQDCPERDVDRGVRAARQDLRRPDGRRASDQREALGARDPDRARRSPASTTRRRAG